MSSSFAPCGATKDFRSASPPGPGVPREVFVRFAPLRPRWTIHFRRPLFTIGRLTTAGGLTDVTSIWLDAYRPPPKRPRRRTGRCAGTERLGPPGRGKSRRISSAPTRPPLPAPHLKMLYRHPSLGRDKRYINLGFKTVKRPYLGSSRRGRGQIGLHPHPEQTPAFSSKSVWHRGAASSPNGAVSGT